MSESAKTLVFIAIAATTLAASFVTKPISAVYDVNKQIGTMLTDDFDPERAKRLSIVKFDEETATLREFEVAEEEGVWTIPSKGGYPADAVSQMAEAATGTTGREILSIASESAADHERFGVVDPRSPTLDVAQSGVGVRVTLADENDEALADLIIGKEVKDEKEQRYVRRQNQDVVYVVKIDPDRFSTDFSDWIEDDLLQINASDIERVRINDYSFEIVRQGLTVFPEWDRRGDYTLRRDAGESKWAAEKLLEFDPDEGESGGYKDAPIGEPEALDQDALRDLGDALDDLRIVNVKPKPTGLSGSLKVDGDYLEKLDRTSVTSLFERGFAAMPGSEDGPLEIQSSEGEVIVTLKDGVEYVLRFGNIESDETNSKDQTEDGVKESGVNRYMFVVTRFNQSMVEAPELEVVPEEPAEEQQPGGDPEGSESADGQSADGQSANEESSGAEPAEDAAAAKPDRDAIIRRNKEKQDAYDARIAEGKKRVEELNERFGNWYYVVSDSVYSKIRLGRNDFVKSAAEGEEGAGDDKPAGDASVLGAPGQPVPGLPSIGG